VNALEVTNVTVHFGGVVAVDGVDLTVAPGEVVGLIGPNGSGKTSLLDAISGFEPYTGTVRVYGEPIDGQRPHRRARGGLARSFQALELLDDLTARENVGVVERNGPLGEADVERALSAVGVEHHAPTRIAAMDNAERRFVALARALAGEPRVVLLDEVAAGLDNGARARMSACVRSAATAGAGIVFVDHDVDLVFGLADRVVVLHRGKLVVTDTPAAVRNNPEVIAAYLGTGT
jgi:ABC-type branched-subunit amino acid transport system ATPase component